MAKRLLAALVLVASAGLTYARAESPARPTEAEPLQTGTATFYAHRFEGRRTASGETFRHAALTAAHATLPFGTLAVITNMTTGKWVIVRITDRLPSRKTLIDLTRSAAAELEMLRSGRIRVSVQVLEPPGAAERAPNESVDSANADLSIAVVGAGMGGLAVAGTLRRTGFTNVRVFEQASRFARIGAGIQMMPNSMKVLRGLGLEERLKRTAFAPYSHLNRVWDTGEVTNELPMPESLYGAPYLCMHRADLHDALASAVPSGSIHLGKKLVGLAQAGKEVTLAFADGTTERADLVIGADGVHSTVREIILGFDQPINKGRVAYRAVFPAALMGGRDLGPSRTKWWGTDRHIVIYYTKADRSEVYFVTSLPEPIEWATRESWSAKGDVKELRAAYAGFHEDVRAVLDACPDCHKWAILEREPLPTWSEGRIVLLGDACHPMTPYMAQGAATSIEDAAILTRCLEDGNVDAALKRYEAHRKPRTSRIQAISSANTWLQKGEPDTSWLYGYDAWSVPLH